jgi:hypothetical protein
MRRLSLPPDFHTFPFALKACAQLGLLPFPLPRPFILKPSNSGSLPICLLPTPSFMSTQFATI